MGGLCQPEGLFCGRGGDASGGKLGCVHAGKNGDGEQARGVGLGGYGFGCGLEHGRASGCVYGEQVSTERGNRADGPGDGVGNVVQLKVEKDGEALLPELFDNGVAGRQIEFEAYFKPAAEAFELRDKGQGLFRGGEVESDDELVLGRAALRGRQITRRDVLRVLRSGHLEDNFTA